MRRCLIVLTLTLGALAIPTSSQAAARDTSLPLFSPSQHRSLLPSHLAPAMHPALTPQAPSPAQQPVTQELGSGIATGSDHFGLSVALSSDGRTALVGAQFTGNSSGSAYVFVWNGASWTSQHQLTASDGSVSDTFGGSVALSSDGNTA